LRMIAPQRTHAELVHDEVECEERGYIEVRGKGRMHTWQLVG